MTSPLPYTPATIRFLQREAATRTFNELADMIGLEVERLRRVCAKHGIELLDAISSDVVSSASRPGRPRGEADPRNAYITVAMTNDVREKLIALADKDGLPLGRYCGNILTKAAGEKQP